MLALSDGNGRLPQLYVNDKVGAPTLLALGCSALSSERFPVGRLSDLPTGKTTARHYLHMLHAASTCRLCVPGERNMLTGCLRPVQPVGSADEVQELNDFGELDSILASGLPEHAQ